mmetsp:Transcript_1704/g.3386  ORF Transcript_1704/g.3386 Transcript_1704/m.3386 type:complete len:297 (+) Transcript_1704:1-891(+)
MRHHRIQFGGFGGGVPQTYSVNSIFVFLMLFRLAFIPRYLARTSRLYSFSARAVSNMNHVVVNWKLVARLFLSSTAVVSAIFFIFAAVFGMMFLVAEHPMGPSSLLYNNYQNGVWLSFITMTTVGYGDSYPQTELGRGVAIAAAFASMIATALFVGTVTNSLTLSVAEARVIEMIQLMEQSSDLRHSASTVICNFWAAAHRRKKHKTDKSRAPNVCFDPDVSVAVNSFRAVRRDYLCSVAEEDAQVQLSNIQSQLTDRLTMVAENLDDYDAGIQALQKDVTDRLETILAAAKAKSG